MRDYLMACPYFWNQVREYTGVYQSVRKHISSWAYFVSPWHTNMCTGLTDELHVNIKDYFEAPWFFAETISQEIGLPRARLSSPVDKAKSW
jgi:hypothetical protein